MLLKNTLARSTLAQIFDLLHWVLSVLELGGALFELGPDVVLVRHASWSVERRHFSIDLTCSNSNCGYGVARKTVRTVID